jgi:hypothetical protein
MLKLFGDFIQIFPPEQDSLELLFTPSSASIRKRWRNQRLSAHFLADYLANFLPLDEEDPNCKKRIKEGKCAVSFVANELLENAIKFNEESSRYKVRFGIQFLEDVEVTAAIFAINSITPEKAASFQEFIQVFLASDPNELYIQQIEKSTEAGSEHISGLGFLTMVNDYGAKLGWRFESSKEPLNSSSNLMITVTSMAQIKI